MAHMSDERRKEMEEEMNRFELEIAGPGESKAAPLHEMTNTRSKPLSPPPAPPAVTVLIPDVLIKAPPPPPPPLSPPAPSVLRPPPPPPVLQAQQSLPSAIRFIPPQLHRQPPKATLRPNFMPIHGHPGSFPPPGPFGPPLGQGLSLGVHSMPPGSMPPGNQMHQILQLPPGAHMSHMPGPMHPMPPGVMPMPMPHQMGNMGVNLPMPPGFCPPPGPPMHLPDPGEQQFFNTNDTTQRDEADEPVSETPASTSGSSSVLAAAPTIYAAPFVKSHADNLSMTTSSANGQDAQVVTTVTSITHFQKNERSAFSFKNDDSSVGPTIPSSTANEENVVSKKKEKKKKFVRMAGGQAWEDNSLLDWESDDFRIFCGDLGNDVTDEVLIRAFSKYPSFVKAKVIRDKRTNKTKGYGFVSFKDPQDFIKAMREMNGRYVGSRPIKLRKSTWRDRNIDLVKKKQKEKEKLGLL